MSTYLLPTIKNVCREPVAERRQVSEININNNGKYLRYTNTGVQEGGWF